MLLTYSVQLGVPASNTMKGHTVSVAPLGDDRYRVIVDGVGEVIVEARRLAVGPAKAHSAGPSAQTWSLCTEGGGAQHVVDVEGGLPDLKISVSGAEPLSLKLLDERDLLAAQKQPAASGPTTVRAPMPGKVVKVLCKVGQSVKAGQGLLIVEAMKMENELRAPSDGVLEAVSVTEGQAIEGGFVVAMLRGPGEGGQGGVGS